MNRYARILFALCFLASVSFATEYNFPINCSNVSDGTPIVINGSNGFDIGGGKQIVWTICQPSLILNYTNTSNYAVYNATAQVPMEVEMGNGTSSSYGDIVSMWRNIGAIGVYHFGGATTDALDSANYLNITATGTITKNNAYLGGQADLNGIGGYPTTGVSAHMPYGEGVHTEQMFLNYSGESGDSFWFFGKSEDSGQRWGFSASIVADNKITNYHWYNDWNNILTLNPNERQMLVMGFDGTNDFAINNDGARLEQTLGATMALSNAQFAIGDWRTTGAYPTANITEFRIFNETKSDEFINQTYKNIIGTEGYGNAGAIEEVNETPLNPIYYNLSLYDNESNFIDYISSETLVDSDGILPSTLEVLTPTGGNKYGIINVTWEADSNPAYEAYDSSTNAPRTVFVRLTYYNDTSSISADSSLYNESSFQVELITPNDEVELSGEDFTFTYSHNALFANASCELDIDGVIQNTQDGLAGNYDYFAGLANGTHYWLVTCYDTEGAGYSSQSSNRTVYANYYPYNEQIELTNGSENVLASPQAMFFDVEGNLNVLYVTDEYDNTQIMRIKTIINGTVAYETNLSIWNVPQLFLVFRGDATKLYFINDSGGGNYEGVLVTLPIYGYSLDIEIIEEIDYVLPITQHDPYTYAQTKQFPVLGITGGVSFYLFTLPSNDTASMLVRFNASPSTFEYLEEFPNGVYGQYQTIAQDVQLSSWLYVMPVDSEGDNILHVFSYNDTDGSVDLGELDPQAYSTEDVSNAIIGFEKYDEKTYAYVTNLNTTTIKLIEENKTYSLNETIANPSHFLFTDEYTFLFFALSGGDTYAYTCYFEEAPTCYRFDSSEYGLVVPYERGFMTSAKRETNRDDTIVKGAIQSASTVILNYNINTYDMKYICYDEKTDARKMFKQRTLTSTSAIELLNYTWGYVLPSAEGGAGLKKIYTTCENGTQRLFLSGLAANFSIDEWTLNSNLGAYYSFTIKNRYGVALPDVKVSMLRFSTLKQAFVVIEQCLSDFNGGCVFFLEPYSPYKILIEAEGFVTQYVDFVPSSVTTINIALDPSGTSFTLPNYNYLFDDITTALTPTSTLINNATNISYTVTSSGSHLQYYGMDVWQTVNSTRQLVYSNNISGSPTGGIEIFEVNESGRYDVEVYIKHENYSVYIPFTRHYQFQVKSGLVKSRDTLQATDDLSGWGIYFFGVVITMLVVGFVSRYTIDGAGIVGLIVLWGFTAIAPDAVIYEAGAIAITTTIASIITSIATVGALYLRYSSQSGG
jgi:hypothetical protein